MPVMYVRKPLSFCLSCRHTDKGFASHRPRVHEPLGASTCRFTLCHGWHKGVPYVARVCAIRGTNPYHTWHKSVPCYAAKMAQATM